MTETKATRFDDGADVGDVLVSSWGYDQTNIDFYIVTRRTEKSVWLKKIHQQIVEGSEGSITEQVIPDLFLRTIAPEAKPHVHRVQHPEWNDGKVIVRLSVNRSAQPWDGKPEYQSHYA